jgi:BMFP domain-containing protein YqiC
MMEQLIQSLLAQLHEPRADLEKNLRALMAEMVERLDLVSRAELERQELQLVEAQRTIAALAQQLDQLEARHSQNLP